MKKDTQTALACVNALKAFTEGHTDVAETFAPGFAQGFFALGQTDRETLLAQLLADLAA
jgi:hypothetical protein